jgi:hypothetical protein
MEVLDSQIDVNSTDFKANADAMMGVVGEWRERG